MIDIGEVEACPEVYRLVRRRMPVIGEGPADRLEFAFDLGLSDYLRRPWDVVELQARVGRIVESEPCVFSWGTFDEMRLSVAGVHVPLTKVESCILRVLARSGDRFVPPGVLCAVCGISVDSVRMAVSRIRRKIGSVVAGSMNEVILSCYGEGYRVRD